MTKDHKPRMAPHGNSPAGLETDGKGNVIPFDRRTEDDKQKVRERLAQAIHTPDDAPGDAEQKNPEGELQNPAPMPRNQQGQGDSKEP